jgi:uncharacterized delta-60 repeat protein
MRRAAACLLAAALVLGWATPGSAQARSGELDPTYGSGGVAMTGFGVGGPEPGTTLLAGAEGSAVLENGGMVVRLQPDGALDTGFGTAGRLRTAFSLGGGRSFGSGAVALDPQGRVLVFGSISDKNKTAIGPENRPVWASVAAVARFTAEGRLDRSFGEGKGYFEGSLGIGPESTSGLVRVNALAGGVDSEGRPVLVVGSPSPGGGCLSKPSVESHPVAVARLSEAGQLDPTFGGGDGVSPISGSGLSPVLKVAGEESVVGVGRVGSLSASCGVGTTIYRLGAGGEPVLGFGPGGRRVFRHLRLSLVEPSGSLILSGQARRTLTLSRVLADGVVDPGFGQGGTVKVQLPLKTGIHIRPATVDPQGRLLLAGFVASPRSGPPRQSSFVVGRLLSDGRLDRSFGKEGWIFTRLPRRLELISARAALDPQGRLLVGGIVTKPGHPDGAFVVARYLLGS